MSDFLSRLAERQLTDDPGIAPKLPSRFGPEVQEAEAIERPIEPRAAPVVDAPPTSPERRSVAPESIERSPVVHTERLESTHEGVVHEHAERSDRSADTPRASQLPLQPEARPEVRTESGERRQPPGHAQEQISEARSVGIPTLRAQSPSPLVPQRSHSPNPYLDYSQPASPPQPQPASSTVTVTIGRVEVRAARPPVQRLPKKEAGKTLGLDEYLERRHGRRR